MYGSEELLKESSINELRELVYSLNDQAGSKREELQLMVGSKYHEFIQSADAISSMKDDASKIGSKLDLFSGNCDDLIKKTKSLLSDANNDSGSVGVVKAALQNTKRPKNGRSSKPFFISSKDVWACLDACDVYAATKLLVVAQIYTSAFQGSEALQRESFVSRFFHEPGITSLLASVTPDLKKQYSLAYESASFLRQTIVEDGHLLLLASGVRIHDKVKTLASLSVITGKSNNDLLVCYMQSADILIEDIMRSCADDDNRGAHSRTLLKCVSCLQETILDIYTIFFKNDAGLTKITQSQQQLLSELGEDLRVRVGTEQDLVDVGVLSATGSDDSDNLRSQFDKWIDRVIRKVILISDRALGTMESAVDVSNLQNMVWRIATFHDNTSMRGQYTLDDWKAASKTLLIKPGSRADISSVETMLWSSALRSPFINQVERLLRSSCFQVLSRTKEKILDNLSHSGIFINLVSNDVDIDFLMRSVKKSRGLGGDNDEGDNDDQVKYDLVKSIESYLTDPSTFNRIASHMFTDMTRPLSSRIFKNAEDVRTVFEQEVLNMLSDVRSDPIREYADEDAVNDPHSSAALTKALFVQSSQLVGHFLNFLRTLSNTLIRAVDARIAARSKELREAEELRKKEDESGADLHIHMVSGNGASNIDIYQDEIVGTLTSGLLMLSRLSWCLKNRGAFLWSALDSHKREYFNTLNGSKRIGGSRRFDLSSDDQLRSAFEIADSDGDGILTCSEAVEAIQAINVSYAVSHGGDGDDSSMYDFLSPTLTPTLTLSELALMCSDLLSPDACIPVARSFECLDTITHHVHGHWSKLVVRDLKASFNSNLLAELGHRNTCGGSGFKSLWIKTSLQLDGGHSEDVVVPTTCSTSLSCFLSLLNHRATRGILSVDTVQEMFSLVGVQSSSSMFDVSLTNSAMKLLRDNTLSCILAAYKDMFGSVGDKYAAAFPGYDTSTKNKKINSWREDCALQMLFDLVVVEKLFSEEDSRVARSISDVKNLWASLIDPINLELLLPAVDERVVGHLQRSQLVLSGFNGCVGHIDDKGSISQRGGAQMTSTESSRHVFTSTTSPKFAMLPSSVSMSTLPFARSTVYDVLSDSGGALSDVSSKGIGSGGSFSAATGAAAKRDEVVEGEGGSLGKYLSFFNT
jgi:hypothetical protein